MSNKLEPVAHYPGLDGLRFVAFLLVFIHNAEPLLTHSALATLSAHGWVGVDLFFCLSAFLITRLLRTELEQIGSINVRRFYARRALRIFPLYFAYVLVAALIVDRIPGWNTNLIGHLAVLSTFSYNIGYFALLPSPILIFIHLWSVSYEMQFYAVAPWLTIALQRLGMRSTWSLLILLLLLGNVIRSAFILERLAHPAIYFLPVTHFDSLLGGVILGIGLLDGVLSELNGWLLFTLGVLFNLSILLLPNFDVMGWSLMLMYPLVAIGMALIVYAVAEARPAQIARMLSTKIFSYLGVISFGLYVFHFSALHLASLIGTNWLRIAPDRMQQHAATILIVALALTIAFASLSYRFLEQPFLNLKSRWNYGLV